LFGQYKFCSTFIFKVINEFYRSLTYIKYNDWSYYYDITISLICKEENPYHKNKFYIDRYFGYNVTKLTLQNDKFAFYNNNVITKIPPHYFPLTLAHSVTWVIPARRSAALFVALRRRARTTFAFYFRPTVFRRTSFRPSPKSCPVRTTKNHVFSDFYVLVIPRIATVVTSTWYTAPIVSSANAHVMGNHNVMSSLPSPMVSMFSINDRPNTSANNFRPRPPVPIRSCTTRPCSNSRFPHITQAVRRANALQHIGSRTACSIPCR